MVNQPATGCFGLVRLLSPWQILAGERSRAHINNRAVRMAACGQTGAASHEEPVRLREWHEQPDPAGPLEDQL